MADGSQLARIPQARKLIDAEDNSEGITVWREAWVGFSITDTRTGQSVQIDDHSLIREIAESMLAAIEGRA